MRLAFITGFLFSLALVSPELVFGNPSLVKSKIPELVIYTYDSFAARGGLGSAVFPLFEKQCGCKIRVVTSGDGGQLLTRLELDSHREKRVAHVVVGIDQNIWEQIRPWTASWASWLPLGYSKLAKETLIEAGFLPYDYGVLTWMVDRKALKKMGLSSPRSLNDLLKPEWKRNFILEDPRTSTPGLLFLLYTQAVFGNSAWNFWQQFRGQWLTLATGWDAAYRLFLNQEAPLVWSYVTSQAYEIEQGANEDEKKRYEALLLKEGQALQIEGAVLVKGFDTHPEEGQLAKKFMEFLISPMVQKLVPQRNWMFPARMNVELPPSYKNLPKAQKLIPIFAKPKEIEETLSQWSRIVDQ